MSQFLLVSRESPTRHTHHKAEAGDRCPDCQQGHLVFRIETVPGDTTWLSFKKPDQDYIQGLICQNCGLGYNGPLQLRELRSYTKEVLKSFTNPDNAPPDSCGRCQVELKRLTFKHSDHGPQTQDYLICGQCGQVHWVFPIQTP